MRFLSALRFLTILPLPWPRDTDARAMGRSLPFFPLVGLLLGLMLAGLDRLLALAAPPAVTAGLLLAALALATGGLHLDGLADTFDGLASRGGPEDKRAVMRDSRVGALGVVGVVSVLLIKYGSLVSLPPGSRTAALVLMPMLGRWAMAYAIRRHPYGRAEGLGAAFKAGASALGLLAATAIAAVPALLLLRVEGAVLLAAAWLAVAGWGAFLSRQFGGLTGDNYGAVNEVVEVVVLVLVVMFAGTGWLK